MKVCIIVSNFYPEISKLLIDGAVSKLKKNKLTNIKIFTVPGTFEIPVLVSNLIEKYDLSRFDKGTKSQKNLYFSHSYGFPYLSGIGAYYFNKKSLYFTEVNTSFAFSGVNLGYNYKLFNDFYGFKWCLIFLNILNDFKWF